MCDISSFEATYILQEWYIVSVLKLYFCLNGLVSITRHCMTLGIGSHRNKYLKLCVDLLCSYCKLTYAPKYFLVLNANSTEHEIYPAQNFNINVNSFIDLQSSMSILIWAATWENRIFANAKTKTQISFAVTAKLVSAFFRYTDSTITLLPDTKFQASSHLMRLYSPVSVGPGRKPQRPVFSQRGSLDSDYFNILV